MPKVKPEVKPVEPVKEFNEMEELQARQAKMLAFREEMLAEGWQSLGKLDERLGAVNARIAELEKLV